MFLPLYRGGGVPGLEQDRIALSDGWLSVGLLLDDTFAGAMRTLRDAIAIEVEDVTPGEVVAYEDIAEWLGLDRPAVPCGGQADLDHPGCGRLRALPGRDPR